MKYPGYVTSNFTLFQDFLHANKKLLLNFNTSTVQFNNLINCYPMRWYLSKSIV